MTMQDTARVLVLDDDAELRGLLERYLSAHGHVVRTVADAVQLDRLMARERFDALVLDVSLPGEDGFSVCRRLRAQGDWLPIVMLTARGDPVDRVVGLEIGADDYMAKPFEPRELLARLNAQLRRSRLAAPEGTLPAPDTVPVGSWTFDAAGARLLRDGEAVDLKPAECALLAALVSHPNRPLGRERLIELTHGRQSDLADRSMDVQIMRLRRLVEDDPARPRLIRTVWGTGYVYVPGRSA